MNQTRLSRTHLFRRIMVTLGSVLMLGAVAVTATTASATTVTISKITQGGTGTANFTGNNGIGAQSVTTLAAGVAKSTAAITLAADGFPTTITESSAPGYVLTAISCSGLAAGGVATVNLGNGSVGLNAVATKTGAAINCTFTNTRISLTLKKNITGTPIDGGKFNLSITGGHPSVAAPQAVNVGSGGSTGVVNVDAGATITIAETAGAATVLTNYAPGFSCIDGTGATVAFTPSATLGQVTINTPGSISSLAAATITCTIDNQANAPANPPGRGGLYHPGQYLQY